MNSGAGLNMLPCTEKPLLLPFFLCLLLFFVAGDKVGGICPVPGSETQEGGILPSVTEWLSSGDVLFQPQGAEF